MNNPRFKLLANYEDNYDINSEVNTETIWAIQNTADSHGEANGYGNKLHLYFGYPYDLEPGMVRDIANDRPFRRFRPTVWLLGLWDRTKDAPVRCHLQGRLVLEQRGEHSEGRVGHRSSPSGTPPRGVYRGGKGGHALQGLQSVGAATRSSRC